MVDPVGIKAAATVSRPVAPVAPVAVAASPQPSVQSDAVRATSSLQTLSQSASASAPVDHERVTKIKKAIEDGKFPLLPATIADRLLALKLEWNPNEPA